MFVSFEGIDGSGKTSLLESMAKHYSALGEHVLVTREPGGSNLGKKLRTMLLESEGDELDPRAELMLFLADRAQHVAETILPAIKEGTLVFCDRFMDSTFAYQGGGRNLKLDELQILNRVASSAVKPDLTFLLDLSVETAQSRCFARDRLGGTARFDTYASSFHESVRKTYLLLADLFPERIITLNAEKTLPELVEEACCILDARL